MLKGLLILVAIPFVFANPLLQPVHECEPDPVLGHASETTGLQALLSGRPTVNVRDFGAAGNGVQDDLSAFIRAIASLPEGGGIAYVPPSPQPYMLRDTLRIGRSGIVLMGEGTDPTVIKLMSSALGPRSITPVVEFAAENGPAESVGVLNLTIDGNRRGNPGHSEFNPGLQFRTDGDYPLTGISVTNVRIENTAGDSLTLRSSAVKGPHLISTVSIRDSAFQDPNGKDAFGNARQGIAIIGATEVRILSSQFHNMPAAAIDLEPNPGRHQPISRVLVQANRIDSAMVGIFITSNLRSAVTDVGLVRNTISARAAAVVLRQQGAELKNVALIGNSLSAPIPVMREGNLLHVLHCPP